MVILPNPCSSWGDSHYSGAGHHELHARAAVLTGLNLFLVQFHHVFIICMHALLFSRQVQTCSVVLMSTYSAVYCKFFTQTRVRTEVIFSHVFIFLGRGHGCIRGPHPFHSFHFVQKYPVNHDWRRFLCFF
jgi:hypothetical protein